MNNSDVEKLYEIVLGKVFNYLSYGRKTRKEISRKIDVYLQKSKRNSEDKEIVRNKIYQRLEDLNMIDDSLVVDDLLAKISVSSKPKNKKNLRNIMFKRGLNSSDSSMILDTLGEDYDYSAALHDYQKKAKIYTDENKIKKYLLSKGYSYELISRVLEDNNNR